MSRKSESKEKLVGADELIDRIKQAEATASRARGIEERSTTALFKLINTETRRVLVEFNRSQTRYQVETENRFSIGLNEDGLNGFGCIADVGINLVRIGNRCSPPKGMSVLLPNEQECEKLETRLSASLAKRLGLKRRKIRIWFWYPDSDI